MQLTKLYYKLSIKGAKKQCPVCKESFETRTKMFEHYTFIHPEAPIYPCSSCDEKYITLSALNAHVFKAHERKLSETKCIFCAKEFETKEIVKSHIDSEHQDKKYHCLMCDQKYLAIHALQKHIEKIHEGKRYQCTECGEIFDTVTLLESHTAKVHDRSKLFPCPHCPNILANKKGLDKHIAFVHEKKFPPQLRCPQCGEGFKDKRQKEDHILTTHQSMKFACRLCGKTYNSSMTLKVRCSNIIFLDDLNIFKVTFEN